MEKEQKKKKTEQLLLGISAILGIIAAGLTFTNLPPSEASASLISAAFVSLLAGAGATLIIYSILSKIVGEKSEDQESNPI